MHQPVLRDEVLSFLDLKAGDLVLDATVGGGGHSKEILRAIGPSGKLIGFDADPEAIARSREALKEFEGSFVLFNENFRCLARVLDEQGIGPLDAALFDFGISSLQMDDASRGFSIKESGPLDMRMDRRLATKAYDIVNRLREDELSGIIKDFGEERFYNRISRAIVQERSRKKIETTGDLAAVIHRAVGSRYGRGRIDPATRTFQAIRITVNDELSAIGEGLKQAIKRLASGARISAISFHSLEDRIVKNMFKEYSVLNELKIITKKPVRPGEEETMNNPRSRSGRLRVAERI
jgi:16S rRNA (cytosine1402-N4)-methyltransferase